MFFHLSTILTFYESISLVSCFLCILVLQISCKTITKNVPHWLTLILILLTNDIEQNPGPQSQNNYFSFVNWNLNSLVKGNFERVTLIDAHNTIFDYDIISDCETSLKDSMEIPEPLLREYNFISGDQPGDLELFFI